MRALLAIALVGCSTDLSPPTGATVVFDPQIAQLCALDPSLPCGRVYMFEAPATNELGHVELCIWQGWDGMADVSDYDLSPAVAQYGAAELTPRFDGLNGCRWCCAELEGAPCPPKGCNAKDGCYCQAP